MALEAQRLDWVEKFITYKESMVAEMLLYCKSNTFEWGLVGVLISANALEVVDDRQFRSKVLELLIKIYKTGNTTDSPPSWLGMLHSLSVPAGRDRDWAGLAQCYFLLNKPEEVGTMLRELLDDHDK